ncbi:MAG: hypothetical protein GF311_03280 [Candidatus Lokiarchaeota archaeon]|nr:hypothetical protein [Candidatus Lokiarchaeota archaeon]
MAIRWDDIESSTMNPADYLDYVEKDTKLKENYNQYSPNEEILDKISNIITKKNEKVNLLAIGAEWCKDCAKQVPAMLKIANSLENDIFHFEILYGVKTNPFHKEDEPLWHEKHSPPEATDPRFALEAIPTFYIFTKEGTYLGRIVEGPEDKKTLEEEILEILEKDL